MNVLHYTPSISFHSAGVGMCMQLLAKDLSKKARLTIVTHRTDHDLPIDNCTLINLPPMKLVGNRCRHVFEYALDVIRPDLVHIHSCWEPLSAFAQKWARQRGYRTVYTPHGMLAPYALQQHRFTRKLPAMMLYQRKALNTADVIHVTSEKERADVEQLKLRPPCAVVPIGVDVNAIAMRTDWKSQRSMLFLSRVNRVKGIEFLIDAVGEMKDALAGYTIYIYGMGNETYIQSLRERAKQLGIADIVRFQGLAEGEEKWRLLRQADVLLLPSYTENFGIAAAEAMASGTPVITTQGTPWQDLQRRQCGWWVPVGKEPLKEALHALLQTTTAEREQMGRRARQLIEEKYSTKAMAEGMLQLYNSILQ